MERYKGSLAGNIRTGEMERDALISSGLAYMLKERLMDVSDIYMVYVCNICGLFAQRLKTEISKPKTSEDDVYWCPACNNKNRISKVIVPYAFKLLVQELMGMNIAPRIRCNISEFND